MSIVEPNQIDTKLYCYSERFAAEKLRTFGGGIFLTFATRIQTPEELGQILARQVDHWERTHPYEFDFDMANGESPVWRNIPNSTYSQGSLSPSEYLEMREAFYRELSEIEEEDLEDEE